MTVLEAICILFDQPFPQQWSGMLCDAIVYCNGTDDEIEVKTTLLNQNFRQRLADAQPHLITSAQVCISISITTHPYQ